MEKFSNLEAVGANADSILEEINENENRRIDPESFRGVRGFIDEEIDKDIKDVEQKKARIELSDGEHEGIDEQVLITSRIAEHVINEGIKNGGWFGDSANIILPSLYDDYFRGVDSIAEFTKDEKNPERMALSMDFTIKKNDIGKKMARNMEFLGRGIIPSVKYFDSPVTGKQKNVWMPKVILAADYSKLQRIKDEYVELIKSGNQEDAKKILENDPVQYVFLDEIRAQLNAYTNICYEFLKNEKAGKLHYRALKIFEGVLAERGIDLDRMKKEGRGDAAHQSLVSLIGKFDREPGK